jgi:hypothetical protein
MEKIVELDLQIKKLMNFFSLDIFEMIANINELTKELLIENC